MNVAFPSARAAAGTGPGVSDAKVSFDSIGVRYASPRGGEVEVLRDISFSVRAGEFVSIVGPSGCGKSTLLRIVADLLAPSFGRVTIDGRPVGHSQEKIGFMFQRDTLLPWASVSENIAVGAELGGIPRADIPRCVRDLAEFLGLSGFEHHRPHQLSGGMRQRVALGRLMAYEPHIYLLDEPFGALDSQTKTAMGKELTRVWARHRRSVLFVTHDIEEAVTLSDRVIVLSTRPATVQLDLPIALSRPRSASALRRDPAFADYVDRIWSELEGLAG